MGSQPFLALEYSDNLKDICSQFQWYFRTGRKFTRSLSVRSAVGMWIYCLNTSPHDRPSVSRPRRDSAELVSRSVRGLLFVRRIQSERSPGATLQSRRGDVFLFPLASFEHSTVVAETLITVSAKVNQWPQAPPLFRVRALLPSRMSNSWFFFAQGRSSHQCAAHRDPKRGPFPSAPPVQEQALHPHPGEAQMGQVQADLQVLTPPQTSPWGREWRARACFLRRSGISLSQSQTSILSSKPVGRDGAFEPNVSVNCVVPNLLQTDPDPNLSLNEPS